MVDPPAVPPSAHLINVAARNARHGRGHLALRLDSAIWHAATCTMVATSWGHDHHPSQQGRSARNPGGFNLDFKQTSARRLVVNNVDGAA